MDVTYICGQTGEKVTSSDGMPAGWIIPPYSLAREEKERPLPPKYSVVCFSSRAAMGRFIEINMAENY